MWARVTNSNRTTCLMYWLFIQKMAIDIAHSKVCCRNVSISMHARARQLLLSAMLNKILYIKITRTVKMAVGQFRRLYMQICCTSKHFAFIMNIFDSSVSRCNTFINGLLCSLRPVALENWNVFRKVPYCYLDFVFAFPFLWVDLNSDRVHTILINQTISDVESLTFCCCCRNDDAYCCCRIILVFLCGTFKSYQMAFCYLHN